jgi:hypothetical protein
VTEQPHDIPEEAPERSAPLIVRQKPKRTLRVWVSYILFAVSAALFVVVLVMYIRGRDDEDALPPPSVPAGQNRLIDVRDALNNNGLKADFGRGANRAKGVSEVAQLIEVNGETIYVFIYPDPTQRQRDQDALASSSLEILNTLGTPIAENPPYLYGGSNVLVAVYSDDASLREKIQSAIEGLP